MRIDVRSDVNEAIRQNKHLQDDLLRAAARAVNLTATQVRIAAINDIAKRNPEFTKATVRGYITIRKAKFTKASTRKDGTLRVNYGGIAAVVSAQGKAPNLIYFVPPGARSPAAWRQGSGVAAHVAGKTTIYDGSFIVRARNGKMIVVSRSSKAKADPKGMRYKDGTGKWKWKPKWSKGLYGPPLRALAGNEHTWQVMIEAANMHWPIAWKKYSVMVLNG